MKLISIVVPCYNEADNLLILYEQIKSFFAARKIDHEIIFIDDGSSDGSDRVFEHLVAIDHVVTAIIFSRNFSGPQPAILAGLRQAAGEAVIVMDADLQHPVRYIAEFLDQWHHGADVVYSIKSSCRESMARRIGYWVFYKVLSGFSYIKIPNAGDFCLMSRRIVDAIIAMPDAIVWIRGMRAMAGGKQVGIKYECPPRQSGKTSFSLWRYLQVARESIRSYSYMPLRGVFTLALCLSVVTLIAIPVLIVNCADPVVVVAIFVGTTQFLITGVCANSLQQILVELSKVTGRRHNDW